MSDQSTPSRVNPWPIIAMTAIACVGIAAATVLILSGHSVGDLLAVLAVVGVPVLGYMAGMLHQKVDEVKTNTNGNLTVLRDAMIQMATAQQSANNSPPVLVVKPLDPPAELAPAEAA